MIRGYDLLPLSDLAEALGVLHHQTIQLLLEFKRDAASTTTSFELGSYLLPPLGVLTWLTLKASGSSSQDSLSHAWSHL